LNADQDIGSYWIRAVPNVGDTSFTDSINLAILSYEGSDPSNMTDPTENVPISVLPLNETDLHPLVSTAVPGNATAGGADININITVGLNNGGTAFLVNGVSFDSPTVPVLLQILTGTPASELLPEGSIYPLGINQSVEIFFPNGAGGLNTGGPHPVHLHGHNFHVVRSAGATEYNYVDPVIRDVVSLGGTDDNVTIRFQTDNPGPWFMHCHIDWHLEKGFAVVMAEDVPDVSTAVTPPATWSALCPVYNIFANVTT
jgi:iron transport multicopper oxidase